MKSDKHKNLKEKLLKKELSFLEVKNELLEWAQNDLYKTESENNLDFLNDDEVIKYIESVEQEIKNEYYNILSITEFYIGQRLVNDSKEVALIHFNKALTCSEKANASESWKNYIKGTISYLEGNRISEEIIENITDEQNAEILRSLNVGLRKRGFPSYMEDYLR